MRGTFNPLPFVFVPSEAVDERPAAAAYLSTDHFRGHMREKARGISPEASERLEEQWPRLLDAVLLRETASMCAAMREGFANYSALN